MYGVQSSKQYTRDSSGLTHTIRMIKFSYVELRQKTHCTEFYLHTWQYLISTAGIVKSTTSNLDEDIVTGI